MYVDPHEVVRLVHFFLATFIIVALLSLLGDLKVLGDGIPHCRAQGLEIEPPISGIFMGGGILQA
jgi:hypothetical protein